MKYNFYDAIEAIVSGKDNETQRLGSDMLDSIIRSDRTEADEAAIKDEMKVHFKGRTYASLEDLCNRIGYNVSGVKKAWRNSFEYERYVRRHFSAREVSELDSPLKELVDLEEIYAFYDWFHQSEADVLIA